MELAQALLDDRFFDQVKSFLASLHKLNSRSDQRREKDDKFAAEMDVDSINIFLEDGASRNLVENNILYIQT